MKDFGGCFHTAARKTSLALTKCRQVEKEKGVRLSAKVIAQEYEKKVKIVGEPVSDNFVDAAVTLWDRALNDKACMKAVMDAEEAFNKRSPFDGASKMEAIVKKAHDLGSIRFVFEGIFDLAKSGLVPLADFSFRVLTGRAPGSEPCVSSSQLP